jgi:uncharacterized membrane protein YphA (DoxX/SURF4 family)
MSMFTYSGSPLTAFERPKRKRFPISLTLASRIYLGVAFILAGLNGHFEVLKSFDVAGQFRECVQTVHSSGYKEVVMALQVLGGISILNKHLVNLGLFILGPIVVQIFVYHLTVRQAGLWLAIPLLLAVAYLAWKNRHAWVETLFCNGRK